tara:strand:+ start:125 stop:319 length:195 start_codon:yes stop_codon:yes gene_type:complete
LFNRVTLPWTPGWDSAPDTRDISEGRDAGDVTAKKFGPDGPVNVPYFVDVAYHVFFLDSKIHLE